MRPCRDCVSYLNFIDRSLRFLLRKTREIGILVYVFMSHVIIIKHLYKLCLTDLYIFVKYISLFTAKCKIERN